MKDGADFCGVKWIAEPVDGFLCLVSTRRTLDVNGFCCDYERCAETTEVWVDSETKKVDRCLLEPGHDGAHHSARCRSWANAR